MSIFTFLRTQDPPTAAKLQRLWARCILAGLIQDVGAWPSMSVEGRMANGSRQSARNPSDLTLTEGAIDRLKRELDVGLWVGGQLLALGALRFRVSYEFYVNGLSVKDMSEEMKVEQRAIYGLQLETAQLLNRSVKNAANLAGINEVIADVDRCIRGHPLTQKNTYWRVGKVSESKRRSCRICNKESVARHRAKQAEGEMA